ncbi:MAG: hypothetical protein ICV87_08320 [Gemmatimonadetes bacterium]|nr:hypothetical protein [Gemmatimonadota bacterium]
MRKLLIATLLAAGTAASTLHAQDERAAGLTPGTRVRVAYPVRNNGLVVDATRGWTVGTVQSIDRESIVLRVRRPEGETEEQIPFDVITDLEVSRGIGSAGGARRRGAVRGGTIGVGLGAIVSAVALLDDRPTDQDLGGDPEPAECSGLCSVFEASRANTIRNLAVGGGLGALAGTLIGGRAREIWEPTQKPRVDLRAHAGGGAALSLTLAL